ncbi:MAG: heme biosynthesis HemY N-terminal domain-containing protein [Sedimenticolaceae bacterium]
MKSLLKLWLFVLAGAGIGIVLSRDSGYVLLSFDNYTVEMSLALLLLLLAALFAALYLGIRLSVRTLHLPADVRDWQHERGARLAHQAMTRGLLEMSEGNWRSAEKHLVRCAEHAETPLLNYLAAARAAQLQGAHDRRDNYIRLAHETMPSADVAVRLTQAELQLADQQLEQALATLKYLRCVAPKHVYVLRLLRRLYEQLGDWEHLRELLPELRRRKVEEEGDLQLLETRTHRALLERAFVSADAHRLGMAWADVPRVLREQPQLLGDYSGYLQELGQDAEAELLLRGAMRKHWDSGLVETYGLLETAEPGKQLSHMEKRLTDHPDDPVLLLTLGRLSLRAQLWGKARGYLEACIGRNGPPQAYRELGQLLERMHEPEQAIEVYRRGLSGRGGPDPVPLPQDIGKAHDNRPMLDEQTAPAPRPPPSQPETSSI